MPARNSRSAAASAPAISISATPKKPIAVDVLGTTYMVKPPKSSLLMAIAKHSSSDAAKRDPQALQRDLDTIVTIMFGKSADAIQKRLADPEDDLDIDHIFEVAEAVTEEATGDPTS